MDTHDRLRSLGLAPPAWQGERHVFPEPAPGERLRDRYRATLLAGAAGDALGRPAEGRSRHELRRRHPEGLRDFRPWRGYRSGPVGTITDDTEMTLVVARWLVADGSEHPDPEPLADAIEVWGRTGRGMGSATRQALALMRSGRAWHESGVGSAGNGGAMRAAPYALRFAGQPDPLRLAACVGTVPTHADVSAVASSVMQAAAVNLCLAAEPGRPPEAVPFLEAVVASVAGFGLPRLAHRGRPDERRSLAERVTEVGDLLDEPLDQVLDHFFNGAFVLETLPVVLWLLLTHGDDPEEALVAAVMAGRDADTTAAILGNLLGALHGTDAFPERWLGEDLEHRDELVGLADALHDLRWGVT